MSKTTTPPNGDQTEESSPSLPNLSTNLVLPALPAAGGMQLVIQPSTPTRPGITGGGGVTVSQTAGKQDIVLQSPEEMGLILFTRTHMDTPQHIIKVGQNGKEYGDLAGKLYISMRERDNEGKITESRRIALQTNANEPVQIFLIGARPYRAYFSKYDPRATAEERRPKCYSNLFVRPDLRYQNPATGEWAFSHQCSMYNGRTNVAVCPMAKWTVDPKAAPGTKAAQVPPLCTEIYEFMVIVLVPGVGTTPALVQFKSTSAAQGVALFGTLVKEMHFGNVRVSREKVAGGTPISLNVTIQANAAGSGYGLKINQGKGLVEYGGDPEVVFTSRETWEQLVQVSMERANDPLPTDNTDFHYGDEDNFADLPEPAPARSNSSPSEADPSTETTVPF